MVIQRWQSLLLLCAAVVMGCFTFCSMAEIQTPLFTLDFTSLGLEYEGESTTGNFVGTYLSTWYFFTIALTSAILPLINIFIYNNLKLQKKLCLVEILFILAVASVACVVAYTSVPEATHVGWTAISICPLIALMATILAYRRIESDRQKLLSADRLR